MTRRPHGHALRGIIIAVPLGLSIWAAIIYAIVRLGR